MNNSSRPFNGPYGPKPNQNFPRLPHFTNKPREDINHNFRVKSPYAFPQQLPSIVRPPVRTPTFIPTGRLLGVNDLRANPELPQYFQYPEHPATEIKNLYRLQPQQMNPAYKVTRGPVPRTFQVIGDLSNTSFKPQNMTRDESSDDDESVVIEKVVDKTVTRIDDDLSIVATVQPNVLPHLRQNCSQYNFIYTASVNSKAEHLNLKKCPKCFCYVCDVSSDMCRFWDNPKVPHCNAHNKANHWKARRNLKPTKLMETFPSLMNQANFKESEKIIENYIISIRKLYFDYKDGASCPASEVPCNCFCHVATACDSYLTCLQCKAVHAAKKAFDYEPVLREIERVSLDILDVLAQDPVAAMVAYESYISELCTHRPCDFNHVTRRHSHPFKDSQCNTPELIDTYITPKLILLFTMYEVGPHFISAYNTSIATSLKPLQLPDLMASFHQMRHWHNKLLRCVMDGTNSAGHFRNGDVLSETIDVIRVRISKLKRDKNYLGLSRYLTCVTVRPTSIKIKDDIWTGNYLKVFLEKQLLLSMACAGRFRDLCRRFDTSSIYQLTKMSVEFALLIFPLMVGQPNNKKEFFDPFLFNGLTLPKSCQEVLMSSKYLPTKQAELEGRNETVMCLFFHICTESNSQLAVSPEFHVWFVRWCNQTRYEKRNECIRLWLDDSSRLLHNAKSRVEFNTYLSFFQQAYDRDPAAKVFTASLALLTYATRVDIDEVMLEQIIRAYENNPWGLFYLFTQSRIIGFKLPLLIKWFTLYFSKSKVIALNVLTLETIDHLIHNFSIPDIFEFLKVIIKPGWIKSYAHRQMVFNTIPAFAQRLAQSCYPGSPEGKWLSDCIINEFINSKNVDSAFNGSCLLLSRAACLVDSLKHFETFNKFVPASHMSKKTLIESVLRTYIEFLEADKLSIANCTTLLEITCKHDFPKIVRDFFEILVERHECYDAITPTALTKFYEILKKDENFSNLFFNLEGSKSLISRLVAQESLTWLICARCAVKMSIHWVALWERFSEIKLEGLFDCICETMLDQFGEWMGQINLGDKSDENRIIGCLSIFCENLCSMIRKYCCNFNSTANKLLAISHKISHDEVRSFYSKMIMNCFTDRTLTPSLAHKQSSPVQFPSVANKATGQSPAAATASVNKQAATSKSRGDNKLTKDSKLTKSDGKSAKNDTSRAKVNNSSCQSTNRRVKKDTARVDVDVDKNATDNIQTSPSNYTEDSSALRIDTESYESTDVRTASGSPDQRTAKRSADVRTPTKSADVRTASESADQRTATEPADLKTTTKSADLKTTTKSADLKTANKSADVRVASGSDDVRVASGSDDVRTTTKSADVRTATKSADVRTASGSADLKTATKSADVRTTTKSADVRTATKSADVRVATKPADVRTPTKPADVRTANKPADVRVASDTNSAEAATDLSTLTTEFKPNSIYVKPSSTSPNTLNPPMLAPSPDFLQTSFLDDQNSSGLKKSICTHCSEEFVHATDTTKCQKCLRMAANKVKQLPVVCPDCKQTNIKMKNFACSYCYRNLFEYCLTPQKPSTLPSTSPLNIVEEEQGSPEKLPSTEKVEDKPVDEGKISKKSLKVKRKPRRKRKKSEESGLEINEESKVASPRPKRCRVLKPVTSLKTVKEDKPVENQKKIIETISDQSDQDFVEDRKMKRMLKKDDVDCKPSKKVKEVIDDKSGDTEAISTPPQSSKNTNVKKNVKAGVKMSKKQRNIISRFKINSPAYSAPQKVSTRKGKKPLTRSKANITTDDSQVFKWLYNRKRKPGPASKTNYFHISPRWKLPKNLKVPEGLMMPLYATVSVNKNQSNYR